jgi:hypothetical protein
MKNAASGVVQQTGDASVQFRENIEQVMTRLLENLNDSSKATTTDMAGIFVEHARMFEETTKTLLESLNETANAMKHSTQAGSNRLSETTSEMVERLEQVVNRAVNAMEGASADVSRQTSEVSINMTTGMKDVFVHHAQVFEARMEPLFTRLDAMAARLSKSTETGAKGLSEAVASVISQLEETATKTAKTMQKVTTGITQQTGDVSTQLSEQIRQILKEQSQQAKVVNTAYGSLESAAERVRTLLKDTSEAFGQVRLFISDLAATTRDLRAVGEVARNAHGELQQISSSFVQQGQFLQQATASHKAVLDEFRKVFDLVSQGLGGILQRIGEEMQQYQERSTESLRFQLQEFDQGIAEVARRITGSVEIISPGLEELADAIDTAAKRIGNNGGRR